MRVALHRSVVAVLASWLVFAVAACAMSGAARTSSAGASTLDRDREAVSDFKKRVQGYVELRDKVRKDAPPPGDLGDMPLRAAWKLGFADRIRAERQAARQGEIFDPAIEKTLRQAMNPELRGASTAAAETRQSIRDEAPPKFALRVNAAYPDAAPVPSMPPNVLQVLPALPEGLEYRIVETHLILLDVEANIVVDFLLNVM